MIQCKNIEKCSIWKPLKAVLNSWKTYVMVFHLNVRNCFNLFTFLFTLLHWWYIVTLSLDISTDWLMVCCGFVSWFSNLLMVYCGFWFQTYWWSVTCYGFLSWYLKLLMVCCGFISLYLNIMMVCCIIIMIFKLTDVCGLLWLYNLISKITDGLLWLYLLIVKLLMVSCGFNSW